MGTYTVNFPTSFKGTSSDFKLLYVADQSYIGNLADLQVLDYLSIQVDYFNGTGLGVSSKANAQTLLKITEIGRWTVVKVFYVGPNSPPASSPSTPSPLTPLLILNL